MFDLRYHVASLAAVFVALVIGIFVGVGLSGRGFVNDAERKNFQARIDELQADRDSAETAAKSAARRGNALDAFAELQTCEVTGEQLFEDGVRNLFTQLSSGSKTVHVAESTPP